MTTMDNGLKSLIISLSMNYLNVIWLKSVGAFRENAICKIWQNKVQCPNIYILQCSE